MLCLLQVVDTTGHPKTSEHLVELHEGFIKELPARHAAFFVGTVMVRLQGTAAHFCVPHHAPGPLQDNTTANMSASKELERRHPRMLGLGCVMHQLNLLMKDFGKVPAQQATGRDSC
jgi:hypothetical protein